MVLGDIHCYTNVLLDNSNVHVPYFIFYLESCKVMVTTLFYFPVLFQSGNSLILYFRIFYFFDSFYFRKLNLSWNMEVQIVIILSSKGS